MVFQFVKPFAVIGQGAVLNEDERIHVVIVAAEILMDDADVLPLAAALEAGVGGFGAAVRIGIIQGVPAGIDQQIGKIRALAHGMGVVDGEGVGGIALRFFRDAQDVVLAVGQNERVLPAAFIAPAVMPGDDIGGVARLAQILYALRQRLLRQRGQGNAGKQQHGGEQFFHVMYLPFFFCIIDV